MDKSSNISLNTLSLGEIGSIKSGSRNMPGGHRCIYCLYGKITILYHFLNFTFHNYHSGRVGFVRAQPWPVVQAQATMGLLPDTQNCGLRMRRECRERFPRPRFQRNLLVSDPGMHNGTCVTHVPWCMTGSLTCGGGENVPGIPGACAIRNFTYLARGPCMLWRSFSRVKPVFYDKDFVAI